MSLLGLDTIINSITNLNHNIINNSTATKNVTNKIKHLVNYKPVSDKFIKVTDS